MKSSFFIFAAAGAVTTAALVFACGNSSNTNDQADGSGEDAGADSTVSNQDGQSQSDSGSPKDGAGDGSLADGGSSDGASEGGIVCTGPAGVLDTTFGDAGMVWLEYPGSGANAVAIQSDGKIVIAGYTNGSLNFALSRLLPTGAVDSTFGDAGLVETALGKFNPGYTALAIQPADGKIVAVGAENLTVGKNSYDFAVVRYLTDGTMDPTFGDGGATTTDFGANDFTADYPKSVALLSDGRILVSGYSSTNGAQSNYSLARFNADGSLDATFGTNGKVLIDVHGTIDAPGLVALVSGGKMIVVGTSAETISANAVNDISAVQLASTGSLDPTFADAGILLENVDQVSPYPSVGGIAIDATGNLIFAGTAELGGASEFILTRATATGILDATFGDGGVVTTNFGARGADSALVLIQPDGRLLAVGTTDVGGSGSGTESITLTRYQSNGALDLAFGTAGLVFTPPPPSSDFVATGAGLNGCSVTVVAYVLYDESGVGQSAMGIARYSR